MVVQMVVMKDKPMAALMVQKLVAMLAVLSEMSWVEK